MGLISRSIPGLLGGVSQQIPASRHPTQCAEQINFWATTDLGMFRRPGTQLIRQLDLSAPGGYSSGGTYGNAHAHIIDKGTRGRSVLVLKNGSLMVFNLDTGAAQQVTAPDGFTYLTATDPQSQFRCVTVADYTFIVNTTKVVAGLPATTPLNPVNKAYVDVHTAVAQTKYSITVGGQMVTYTTPKAGDNPITCGTIAEGLRAALAGTPSLAGYSFGVVGGTNTLRIIRTDGQALSVSASDGWSNDCLRLVSAGVATFAELPARFEAGYVVEVAGTADSPDDSYFVKWDGARWVETMKPGSVYSLDPATMPHRLRADGSGGWVFERNTWADRTTGDDNSVPKPSFWGKALSGVFFHRNRLGFLAQDKVVLSRAGSYFNFWASSATNVLATDPIDLSASAEGVDTLHWATGTNPHGTDQSLILWGSGGEACRQFMLVGGDILSPEDARIVPATAFQVDNAVRPVSLGGQVLFCSKSGASTQVNLFRVGKDSVSTVAEDLTEHVPQYVPSGLRALAVSLTYRAAVAVPLTASDSYKVFKWEAGADDTLTQKEWASFQFAESSTLLAAHWVDRKLYMVSHWTPPGDSSGGRLRIHTMDFSTAASEAGTAVPLHLDMKASPVNRSFDGTQTTVDYPMAVAGGPLCVVKTETGLEPVLLPPLSITPLAASGLTRIVLPGNHVASQLYAGHSFGSRYVFSEPIPLDTQGSPIESAAMRLVRYLVTYKDTGWFEVVVTQPLRGSYTYQFSGRTIGQPGQGASQLSLSSGTFQVPVGTRPAGVTVAITSTSILPARFSYAEWVADLTMKAQR